MILKVVGRRPTATTVQDGRFLSQEARRHRSVSALHFTLIQILHVSRKSGITENCLQTDTYDLRSVDGLVHKKSFNLCSKLPLLDTKTIAFYALY